MIDLKQDAATIIQTTQRFDEFIATHKEELLSQITDDPQRLAIRYYFNVLRELCTQGSNCLAVQAYSTLEALSRVIMEQAANMLYVSMDRGVHVRQLLRSSRLMTKNNGQQWADYLAENNVQNYAANARQANGAALLEHFDNRWPDVKRYPGGKGLFAAVGWGNAYYAFYSPLSDSVHSYSDDIANLVDIGEVFSEAPDFAEQLLRDTEGERRRLAIYHYAAAICLRVEAFGGLCGLRDFPLDVQVIEDIFGDLKTLIIRHDDFDASRES
jgi:hypothetical protein